jgi:hypothetical protein
MKITLLGFQSVSNNIILLADIRLRPVPPAFAHNSKIFKSL